jgi:microcystin-dependent protein
MQGRSPVGIGRGQGLTTVSPGQWRGQETVQPSTATLATHTHPIVVSGGGTLSGTIDVVPGAATGTTEPQAGTSYHLGGVGGRAEGGPYTTNSPGGSPATVEGVSVELGNGIQAGPAGAGNNETNIPPQIGIRFCIALDGIYPPRPN